MTSVARTFPPNDKITEVLRQLAPLAKIRGNPDEFIKALSGPVLEAWLPRRSPQGLLIDEIAPIETELERIASLTEKILARLDTSSSLDEWAKQRLGENFSADRERLKEFLIKVIHLADAAGRRKRRRGGQLISLRSEPQATYDAFVDKVIAATRAVGGNLSVNRNTGEGRLPKFLKGLDPILPPGFRRELSAPGLDRIRQKSGRQIRKK